MPSKLANSFPDLVVARVGRPEFVARRRRPVAVNIPFMASDLRMDWITRRRYGPVSHATIPRRDCNG